MRNLFAKAKVTIGPWIADGFYRDSDAPEPFTESYLKRVKKEVAKIMHQRLLLIRKEVAREEVRTRIKQLGEPYNLQILADIQDPSPFTVSEINAGTFALAHISNIRVSWIQNAWPLKALRTRIGGAMKTTPCSGVSTARRRDTQTIGGISATKRTSSETRPSCSIRNSGCSVFKRMLA